MADPFFLVSGNQYSTSDDLDGLVVGVTNEVPQFILDVLFSNGASLEFYTEEQIYDALDSGEVDGAVLNSPSLIEDTVNDFGLFNYLLLQEGPALLFSEVTGGKTAGKDVFVDFSNSDVTINVLSGNDIAVSYGGNDLLLGGRGNDLMFAGAGADTMRGGNGADSLVGDKGNDRIFGGAGNDILIGGAGNDRILGGANFDTISGDGGADRLFGGNRADDISGGAGRDRLFGQLGNDTLDGGLLGDRLFGGGGADKLFGRRGNDRLDGGNGNDLLVGNAGADTFVFRDGSDFDRIRDFKGVDTLLLDENLWGGGLTAQQVINRFQTDTDRLDFGDGDVVRVNGVDVSTIADQIDFI